MMWYFIIGGLIIWLVYRHKQEQKTSVLMSVSMHVDNSGWEEEKKRKADALKKLKQDFQPAENNKEAVLIAGDAIAEFLVNHHQSVEKIHKKFIELHLSDDIKKQEATIRKELNAYYKKREDISSKAFSIFLAYKHVELLLNNPDVEWKNFVGLQRLQSNWKEDEYFSSLLTVMYAFKSTFSNSPKTEKLSKDIEKTFSLWRSRNSAQGVYEESISSFPSLISASDKHFCILVIIEYLERRYQFNPQYKEELVDWCLRDVEIYEDFLKVFHEHKLFTIDDQVKFHNDPILKEQKLTKVSFDRVRRLKDYMVPRLNSYDILESIYEKEHNIEKLKWIRGIGSHIGYSEDQPMNEQEDVIIADFDFLEITRTIEVKKSGQKGKLAFLNSSQEPCSTEGAFQDYHVQDGWSVMRAEVSFWQAMFCLSFWDEIFEGMGKPVQGQDIPHDLFRGEDFYFNRKSHIDSKYRSLKQHDLCAFINQQLKKTNGSWTRLLFNGDQDMASYTTSDIVQAFLKRVDQESFAKIVYRIAQNPNENRAGLPDFAVWNDKELRMSEVKKVREKVRDSQEAWLGWMVSENIPVEIVRVKGVDT